MTKLIIAISVVVVFIVIVLVVAENKFLYEIHV